MLTLFGNSSDDDEEEITSASSIHCNGLMQCVSSMADACVLHLTKHWLSHNHRSVPFSQRFVAQQDRMETDSSMQRTFSNALSTRLEAKGIYPQHEQSSHNIFDAAVVCKSFQHYSNSSTINTNTYCEDLTLKSFRKSLIHGGILIWNIHHVYDTEPMNRIEETRTREMVQLVQLPEAVWDIDHAQTLMETTFHDASLKQYHYFTSVAVMKRPCTINTRACPWKQTIPVSLLIQQMQTITQKGSPLSSTGSSPSIPTMLQYERYILEQATITPSVKEILSHGPGSAAALSVENIQRAVRALQTHGFTIVRKLFHPSMIEPWTRSALQDFESAHCILKERYQVDLLHPGLDSIDDSNSHSYREPLSYKELAMREDYRVDLRDGPSLQVCRNDCQTLDRSVSSHSASTTSTLQPSIVPAQFKGSYKSLRFHPDILEIVRQVFNPKDENTSTPPLYKGNYGRWNFEGAGPDGTPQPLRIGQVGSIISLPGAADQAIHADTPHLFEHMDLLPCHYANLFIVAHDDPSCCVDEDGNPTGDSNVGGTAFIHGTHSLSVCAKLTTDTLNEDKDRSDGHKNPSHRSAAAMNVAARDELYARIVRPSLQKGDAILFDCRILHFGLANSSISDIRRPLLYVNMTQSFFIDPKNWDDKTPLFDSTRMS